MPELIYRKDGSVVMRTNADPAAGQHRVHGWVKHRVGMDLGRNDPSALVVLRDECLPELTGRGFEQRLGKRRVTVVFEETIQLYSYTDLADYLARRMNQIAHASLAIDASGLGQPFSSVLDQAGIEHWPCVMTAGARLAKDGRNVTVSKTLLIENMAVGFETGALTIADDLPGKQDLLNEVASFELKSTSAGNLILEGGGKGHHADRAIACALAYLQTTHLDDTASGQFKLTGWA